MSIVLSEKLLSLYLEIHIVTTRMLLDSLKSFDISRILLKFLILFKNPVQCCSVYSILKPCINI